MVSKKIAALAAGALMIGSTAAVAQTAPAERINAPVSEESENTGGLGGAALPVAVVFGFVALAAAVGATQDDSSTSP